MYAGLSSEDIPGTHGSVCQLIYLCMHEKNTFFLIEKSKSNLERGKKNTSEVTRICLCLCLIKKRVSLKESVYIQRSVHTFEKYLSHFV